MHGVSDFDDLDHPLIRVTMLLADSAQVADGKLYLLGGGMRSIGPNPQPLGIAVLFEVPWDRADVVHDLLLELLDEDGVPVLIGDRPVIVSGQFTPARQQGQQPGTPLLVPLAINFASLPVPPGHSYVWRLAIDGTSEADWDVRFSVRPPADQIA